MRFLVADLDDLIQPGDEDFAGSGLVTASVVRAGYLAAVPLSGIKGQIGTISPARYLRIMDRLTLYLRREAGLLPS